MEGYKKIKTVNRLSETTQDILHLINEFGKLYNSKEEVRVHFIDDKLKKSRNRYLWSLSTLFFCKLVQSR